MDDISNKYKELLKSDKSKDEIIKELLEQIKQNPEVADSGYSGGSIWYKLKLKIGCTISVDKDYASYRDQILLIGTTALLGANIYVMKEAVNIL